MPWRVEIPAASCYKLQAICANGSKIVSPFRCLYNQVFHPLGSTNYAPEGFGDCRR